MASTDSGFRTILWALLAYVTAQQQCGRGPSKSWSQCSHSSTSIPMALVIPRMLQNISPSSSSSSSISCTPCHNSDRQVQDSGGGGSNSIGPYASGTSQRSEASCTDPGSSYGSASNPPNVPTCYQQTPCIFSSPSFGSPSQTYRSPSQTYGSPYSQPSGIISTYSLLSESAPGLYNPLIYDCSPSDVPCCPSESHCPTPAPEALISGSVSYGSSENSDPSYPSEGGSMPGSSRYGSSRNSNPSYDSGGGMTAGRLYARGSSNPGSNSYTFPTKSTVDPFTSTPTCRCHQLSSGNQYTPPMLPTCKGRNSGSSYNTYSLGSVSSYIDAYLSGGGSSANSSNHPQTLIFCDPSTGAPIKVCSLSSNGSYVCCSTTGPSEDPQLCPCNNRNQCGTPSPSYGPTQTPTCSSKPPACPTPLSNCPTQTPNCPKQNPCCPTPHPARPPQTPTSPTPSQSSTRPSQASNCPTQNPCCPTRSTTSPPETNTFPTTPPTQFSKTSTRALSSPKSDLQSQISGNSSTTEPFNQSIHPNAGLVAHSGDGEGGNRLYSCCNVLTAPSCSDFGSNESSYLMDDCGNGAGGNQICSKVNYVMGGTMVKNCGNGKGGNCIKSCVNIIGDAGKLMSNGALWKSMCNIMLGTGCRNRSSPFGTSGCSSFSYDDNPNDDPCFSSQDPCSEDEYTCNCDYNDN